MINMWPALIPRGRSSTESRDLSSGQALPLSYHVTLNSSPPFPGSHGFIFKITDWTKKFPVFSEFELQSQLSFLKF